MGFFSWTCAKSNLPIMASLAWGDVADGRLSRVTLLDRSGKRAEGVYDGYGAIEGPNGLHLIDDGDWAEALDRGDAKMVLSHLLDAHDTFETLGYSQHEPGQGFFHDEKFVREAFDQGGFRSYAGYVLAFNEELDKKTARDIEPGCANALQQVITAARRQVRRVRAEQFADSWCTPESRMIFVPHLDVRSADTVDSNPRTYFIGPRGRARGVAIQQDGSVFDDVSEMAVGPETAGVRVGEKLARTTTFAPYCDRHVVGDDGDKLGCIVVRTSQLNETVFDVYDAQGAYHGATVSPGHAIEEIGVTLDMKMAETIAHAAPDYTEIVVTDDERMDKEASFQFA